MNYFRRLAPAAAEPLLDEWLALLAAERVDWTLAHRHLAALGRGDAAPLRDLVLDRPRLDAWSERWLAASPDPAAMDVANPLYLPRNNLVEEALAAGVAGDLGPVERLLAAVRSPYVERAGLAAYAEPGPGEPYVTYCGT